MYWHDGWMFGGWLAMLLFWLVFIALIVGTARYLFVNGRREGREREMSARELLDRALRAARSAARNTSASGRTWRNRSKPFSRQCLGRSSARTPRCGLG